MFLININVKILNKMLQTESSSTLKSLPIKSIWLHPWNARLVYNMQINKCNSSYKQNHWQKSFVSIDAKKAFDKIQHPLMLKMNALLAGRGGSRL